MTPTDPESLFKSATRLRDVAERADEIATWATTATVGGGASDYYARRAARLREKAAALESQANDARQAREQEHAQGY